MIRRILILGASYGSLFGTKLLMAVHDVTLVCRRATAELINTRGTEVDLPLRGETAPRRIRSIDLSGRLDAKIERGTLPGARRHNLSLPDPAIPGIMRGDREVARHDTADPRQP